MKKVRGLVFSSGGGMDGMNIDDLKFSKCGIRAEEFNNFFEANTDGTCIRE